MVDLTDPIQVSSLAGVVLTIVVVALAILLKREDIVSVLMRYVEVGVERKYLDKALTSNATLQNTGYNGSTPVEGNAGLHMKVVIGMSIILLQILIRLFKNLRLVI